MPSPTPAGFSTAIVEDPDTGWKVYVLRSKGTSSPAMEARIVPQAGANLYSLKYGDHEILKGPDSLSSLPGYSHGIPILYPIPNRVKDSEFTFGGKKYRFTANERTHFLHGLAHSVAWKLEDFGFHDDHAELNLSLTFEPGTPGFKDFPIKNRINLSYILLDGALEIKFEAENLDEVDFPFGFSIHPWFKVLGKRESTRIQVPAQKHMEAQGLIPSGRLASLDESPKDLRQPTSIKDLDLDDVYWGMVPDKPAQIRSEDTGIQISLQASEAFTHMVVFVPPGEPFFCMENQTCSTDAHNLYEQGLRKESHLIVLKPGQKSGGTIKFAFEAP